MPTSCAAGTNISILVFISIPSPSGAILDSLRLEIERHAVDAIALMRRRRPVGKDMPEMAAATAAMHLDARHAEAAVLGGLHRSGLRIVETRPAGAAFEFLLRLEQRLPTADATESAGALLVIQRTASRTLGAVSAHDLILLRREQLAPFFVRVRDREVFLVHEPLPCAELKPAPHYIGARRVIRQE